MENKILKMINCTRPRDLVADVGFGKGVKKLFVSNFAGVMSQETSRGFGMVFYPCWETHPDT